MLCVPYLSPFNFHAANQNVSRSDIWCNPGATGRGTALNFDCLLETPLHVNAFFLEEEESKLD